MDTNTVASLFALIKEKGEWTSSNICLPVFETLESEEVIEVDLCSTQCRLVVDPAGTLLVPKVYLLLNDF